MSSQFAFTAIQSFSTNDGTVGLLALGVFVALVAAGWQVFAKAGEPGWFVLIPVYNAIVGLKIVGRPIWWIFLLLVPGVAFVVSIVLLVDLSKSFGKGGAFAAGLFFLPFIFLPVLGFGPAEYRGPSVRS